MSIPALSKPRLSVSPLGHGSVLLVMTWSPIAWPRNFSIDGISSTSLSLSVLFVACLCCGVWIAVHLLFGFLAGSVGHLPGLVSFFKVGCLAELWGPCY